MALETRHVDNGPGALIGQTNAIPNTPTVISFAGVGCTQIGIQNQSTTAILYIRYQGATCTTSDFSLSAGTGFVYDGSPITQICVLGSAAAGNYSIIAH